MKWFFNENAVCFHILCQEPAANPHFEGCGMRSSLGFQWIVIHVCQSLNNNALEMSARSDF